MGHRILKLVFVVFLLAATEACRSLPPSSVPGAPSLQARLGYPESQRLLILHADDVAMTPGVTQATLYALASGTVSSASIIATTPFLRDLPEVMPVGGPGLDLGVHLTLTSESADMVWPPAAGASVVPSLVDSSRALPLLVNTASLPRAAEIETELRAQIAAVRSLGVQPTHLDSHRGTLFTNGPEVFGAWRRVAKTECLPIPIPASLFKAYPYLADALEDGHVAINDMFVINPAVPSKSWWAFYANVLHKLQPGVTMLIVHLGEDTGEERLLFRHHKDWDSAWRQRDGEVLASPSFRQMLDRLGIQVVTWRQVGRAATICPQSR